MKNIKRALMLILLTCVFSTLFFNGHYIQVGTTTYAANTNNLYYFNRYTSVKDRVQGTWSEKKDFTKTWYDSATPRMWTGYSWNPDTKMYVGSGEYYDTTGYGVRQNFNNFLDKYKYEIVMGGYCVELHFGNCMASELWTEDKDVQGTLLQANIVALDGTYPDNGLFSDGYWYIKGSRVNNIPTITANLTTEKRIFSERDPIVTISGTFNDSDANDTVSVKYRVDENPSSPSSIITSAIPGAIAKSYTQSMNSEYLAEGIHTVYVWAEDDNGGVSPESTVTFFIDKSAPVLQRPMITVCSATQINVSANATDPAVKGVGSGLDENPFLYNKNGTDSGAWQAGEFKDTGLLPNTKYTYKYKARDKAKNISDYSKEAACYTLANAPVNLRITGVGAAFVALAWDKNGNSDDTKYELYCNGTILYTGTATSYIDTAISGVSTYSEYTYKVRAVNGDSVSTAYTSEVTCCIRVKPDLLKASTVNAHDLTFSWDSNGNPEGTEYEVQLINQQDNTTIGTKIVTTTNVSFNSLNPNMAYMLKVRTKVSVDISGSKNYTEYVKLSAYTAADITSIYLNNQQKSVTGRVLLNGNPQGTDVLVVRSTDSAFSSYVTVKDWNTCAIFSDTNLVEGTTYYYRSMARNGDNILTDWSPTLKIITIPAPPNTLSVQASGINSIRIDWNIVSGADKYHVYRDGKLIADTSDNYFEDSGLEPNNRYSYAVASKNESGESEVSKAISRYTLAADPMSKVKASAKNAVSISINKDMSNVADPDYRVEIKKVGGGETVASTNWSKQTELTLAGLSEDMEYELWITTMNGDRVKNTPVKMITGLKTNNTPIITVSNTSTTASAIAPYNTVTMSGICYDADNEPVKISAVIDGVFKTISLRPAPADNPGADNWSLSWDGNELSEGKYTDIVITAEDAKGSIKTTVYTGTIVIDKTGPKAPIIIPSTTAPTTEPVVIRIENFGDAADKEYRVDGGDWIRYAGPVEITSNCAIEARGIDEYGNSSKTGAISIKNIDKDPPTTLAIHVSDENWSSSDVTVTVIGGADSVSGVSQTRIKIGNGDWEEYKAPVTISAEGVTTVSAITIDNLGQASMETSIQVKIDHTAPKIDRIYMEKGLMYVTASDNIGLNAAAYKYKLKATSNIKDIEAIENSSDPFNLALLIEADRKLENQSTPWIEVNYIKGVKASDKYEVFVRDLAGNISSAVITVNKESGTIYGQLTPEELKELENQQTKNNDSSSSNKKETENIEQIKQKEAVKEAEKALKDVVATADDTPANSQTGQITVDLSNMLKTMTKTTSPIYNTRCRLELSQKKTGVLIYSKILNNTSKIVIPDLDDATTYIIRLVILDQDGKEIKDKSFEQTTPDRTPPVITALKTENNNLEVKAIDNAGLASNAYKYQLVSVNITTASTDPAADIDAVRRTAKILEGNTWSMDTWTNSSKLENVRANMVIKTVVRDASGNTTEQIVVIENTDKEYVNLINAGNPYILNTGSTGNISNHFNTMGWDAEYSINDPSIARIDTLGNISGLKSGEAIVTAKNIKTGETKQLLIRIKNVSAALSVRRIIVEKDSVTNIKMLYKDQLISESGTLDNLEWSCEDSAIGDLSSDGQFTAKKNGTTRVIVSRQTNRMIVYVIVAQAGSVKSDIQEIHIQAPYLINKGSSMQLDNMVKCLDFKDRSININEFTVFEVSNDKILKLGQDGSILALNEGAAEITAVDLINNIYAKIKVNVVDVTPVKTGFTDISGHWAEKFFNTDVTKSIIRGYSDKQFKPDKKVTNSEFLIMLSKTMQLKGQPHLTDRTQMKYNGLNMNDPVYNYAASVLINVRPIYSTLVFGTQMKDTDTISRGEVAELIMAFTQGKLEHKVKKYNYKDLKGDPHEDALKYCIETGIYSGCGKNMISGQKTLTRAEMLVVMNRLAGVLK